VFHLTRRELLQLKSDALGNLTVQSKEKKRPLRFRAMPITLALLSPFNILRYSSFQLRLSRYTKTKSVNISQIYNSRRRYPSGFFSRRRRGNLSFRYGLVWTLPCTSIQELQTTRTIRLSLTQVNLLYSFPRQDTKSQPSDSKGKVIIPTTS